MIKTIWTSAGLATLYRPIGRSAPWSYIRSIYLVSSRIKLTGTLWTRLIGSTLELRKYPRPSCEQRISHQQHLGAAKLPSRLRKPILTACENRLCSSVWLILFLWYIFKIFLAIYVHAYTKYFVKTLSSETKYGIYFWADGVHCYNTKYNYTSVQLGGIQSQLLVRRFSSMSSHVPPPPSPNDDPRTSIEEWHLTARKDEPGTRRPLWLSSPRGASRRACHHHRLDPWPIHAAASPICAQSVLLLSFKSHPHVLPLSSPNLRRSETIYTVVEWQGRR